MDELVELVSEKTGLPEAKAREAANVVVDFLKERLPDPIAGQIDTVLEGGNPDLSDLQKGLGGLLGG